MAENQLKNIKSTLDIIQDIQESYKKIDEVSKSEKVTANVLDPLKNLIDQVGEFCNQVENQKITGEQLKTVDTLLTNVVSSLDNINKTLKIQPPENINLKPVIDSILLVINELSQIAGIKIPDTLSRTEESISTAIGSFIKILEAFRGLNVDSYNTVTISNLADIAGPVSKVLTSLNNITNLRIREVDNKLIDQISKNIDSYKKLLTGVVLDVYNIISKNSNTTSQIKDLDTYIKNVSNIIKFIQSLDDTMNFDKSKEKKRIPKRTILTGVRASLNIVSNIATYIKNTKIDVNKNDLSDFQDTTSSIKCIINDITELLNAITIKDILLLNIRFVVIKSFIGEFVDNLEDIKITLQGIGEVDLTKVTETINSFTNVLDTLKNIKFGVKDGISLEIRLLWIKSIMSILIEDINRITSKFTKMKPIENANVIQTNLNELIRIINLFKEIKISTKERVLIQLSIKYVIDLINILTKQTSKIKEVKEKNFKPIITFLDNLLTIIEKLKKSTKIAEKTIKQIRNIIIGIDLIIATLLLSLPLIGLFIISAPIVISAIFLFSRIMMLISRMLITVAPNIIVSSALLVGVVAVLILVVLELTLLVQVSKVFLRRYLDILLILGGISLIILALGGIGYLISFVVPFLVGFAIGVLAVTTAILGILLIVGMLRLIQEIKLDHEAIRATIAEVLNEVMYILKVLTTSPFEYGTEDESKSNWFKRQFTGFANFTSALWGMGTIVATTIAVGGILLMSLMLKTLSYIKLDEGKIRNNINKILGIVQEITNNLNRPLQFNKSTFDSGILGGLFTLISPQFGAVVSSILTMVYVAGTLISVVAITLIAGMLKIIQEIRIDRNKISNNIKEIFATVQEITDALNQPILSTSQFDRGILGGLISYISPQIGNLWNSIITMAYLALSVVNIGAVLLISKMLGSIGNLDMGIIEQAKENARIVLNTAQNIIDMIWNADYKEDEKQPKKWWQKAIEWIGLKDFAEAIVNMRKLAEMLIVIGSIAKLSEQLNSIKIETSVGEVINNTKTVLRASAQICNEALGESKIKMSGRELENWADNIKLQRKLFKNIADLAKAEAKVAQAVTIEDVMSGYKLSTSSLALVDDMLGNLTRLSVDPDSLKEKLSVVDAMNRTIGGIVSVSDNDIKNTKGLMDEYVRFINRLDQADLQRLTITEKMMSHWAYIAKMIDGDFDKLVLMLAEHMMPMIEKMDKTMDGVSEVQANIIKQLTDPNLGSATENGEDTSGSQISIGNPGDSAEGMGQTSQTPVEPQENQKLPDNSESLLDIQTPTVTTKTNPTEFNLFGDLGSKSNPVWARIVDS